MFIQNFVKAFHLVDILARLIKHARYQACQEVDVRPDQRAIFSLDPDDTVCFGNITVPGFPRRIRVRARVTSLSLVFGCRTVQIAKLLLGNMSTWYCRNWIVLHMMLEN